MDSHMYEDMREKYPFASERTIQKKLWEELQKTEQRGNVLTVPAGYFNRPQKGGGEVIEKWITVNGKTYKIVCEKDSASSKIYSREFIY